MVNKLAESVFENSALEFYCIDLNGRFIEANSTFCETLGYSREELVSLTISDVDPDFQTDQWERLLAQLRSGHHLRFETVYRHKNGTPCPVEVSMSLLQVTGREYIFGLAHDIHDRKQAETALRERIQYYHAILDTTKDGFLMVDKTGTIIEVNDAYCRMSGFSKEELLKMKIFDLDASESAEAITRHIKNVMKSGNDLFETCHRRKSGEIWSAEISVSYSELGGGRFFSLCRDISERKRQEQLIELRNQLSELVRSSDQDTLLQTALDKAEAATRSQIGFFHFVERDQDTISLQVWSTSTLEKFCFAEGHGMHYPISKAGVWVDCIHQRRPVIHNDYESLPHKKGMPEGHPQLIRELTVPLFRNNLIVAVIGVGNKEQDYTEEDVQIVQQIANLAFDYVERQQAETQVEHMAYYDILTGLPNRSLLSDRLHQAAAQSRRMKQLLAVCYMDLNDFKPVNDQYGHHIGDALLITLAKRLKENLREGDTLARLGGDEFVLILTGLSSPYECDDIVKRILNLIAVPFELDGHRIHVSGSIGVTLYPTDDTDPDTLLRHADQAMYLAKETKTSTYRLYKPVQDINLKMHQKLLQEFEIALHQNQLVLYYQPKVDLRNGALIGMEALVRWNHPARGLLYPGDFLPFIENTPLEIALGEWVTLCALEQLSQWQAQGHTFTLSINVSPRHIQLQGFADFLADALKNYPAEIAKSLELEILEIAAISDTEKVAKVMNACAQLGIHFSLDDFGTGYSSLAYFHQLPIDILKIDQNFVKGIISNPANLDIVEGVLRLAETLHRPVIAEGVESIEIGLILLHLGCFYAQGYGIARPMPAETFSTWLEGWEHNSIWHQLPQQTPDNHDDNYDINVIIFSHRNWLNGVVEYLQNETTAKQPPAGEQLCQFSRWYRGIGKTKYGGREMFAFLHPKHHQMHALAEELQELVESGKREQALLELDTLRKTTDDLTEMLRILANQQS